MIVDGVFEGCLLGWIDGIDGLADEILVDGLEEGFNDGLYVGFDDGTLPVVIDGLVDSFDDGFDDGLVDGFDNLHLGTDPYPCIDIVDKHDA